VRETSSTETKLLAEGYERTGHRRFVQAWFWAHLLVKFSQERTRGGTEEC
jgi:hypothetical protein